MKEGDLNNNIAEHHLKTNDAIDWDCYMFNLQYRLLSTNYTRKLRFTNLEQTALNRCQPLHAPYKRFTQQETITPCLLFILQSIYLHYLSLHMSSQPITSRTYQRLLYLLTNQITHQGF